MTVALLQERKQYLQACLTRDGRRQEDDIFHWRYWIGDTQVCGPFYEAALGVGNNYMVGIRKRIKENDVQAPEHGNKHRVKGIKKMTLCAWMAQFFQDNGNHCPNTTQVLLPAFMTKENVYMEFMLQLKPEEQAQLKVSSGYFYRVWKEEYPTVRSAKYNSFNKCDVCSNLKLFIQEAKTKEKKGTNYVLRVTCH